MPVIRWAPCLPGERHLPDRSLLPLAPTRARPYREARRQRANGRGTAAERRLAEANAFPFIAEDKREVGCDARTEGAEAGGLSASPVLFHARPRPDHRRFRRRPIGYRDLQPGRRAAWIRRGLDHAVIIPADGRDSGDLGTDWARDGSRDCWERVPQLWSGLCLGPRTPPVRRQH